MNLSTVRTFIKQHIPESICFLLFILLALVSYCVHEMYYDEAQAWQIARTASFKDILFLIPHWEGHPPFWHLFLAIPAKLGVPWQWGVNSIGMLLMVASGFLIFFKAPFPRWIRCLLPFNYFLFYQYGIIVRPYSLLLFIMLLLAVYFPQKDKHSTLYIVLLAALCACHLFGIAIAGGITLAWLWDLKNHRPWKQYIVSLLKDNRFHKMLMLLGFVIVLFFAMKQTDGVLDNYLSLTESVFKQLLYVLFALPADTVLTNLGDNVMVMNQDFPWTGLLASGIIGLLVWTLTLLYLPRKRLLYLLLPYLCLDIIFLHYVSRHHIGLVLILFMWYAWITLQEFPLVTRFPQTLNSLAKALLALVLVFPISWTGYSLYLDYKLPLFPGKQIVEFLEKHELTHKTIFVAWQIMPVSSEELSFWADPHYMPIATMLSVYLPHNIIANFNNGTDQAYVINRSSPEKEYRETVKYWHSLGLPDVLIGPAALPMLYSDPDILKKYRAALIVHSSTPWKFNIPERNDNTVYLRQDLWNELKDKVLANYKPPTKNDTI